MKKIWMLLFLLCLPLLAQNPYQQGRSGYSQNILWRDLHPSTQDSIRAAIIDSITALSVDGVTVLNDGALKIKVINSTDDLPGLAADSVGMPVFVKQVGNSGTGGGIFRWTTASYTADSVAVFNGSSGKFVREEWYYGSRVFNVGWAGALGDGSTDNADAFALLRRAALVQGSGYFKLGKGTYKTSETWLDSTAFGIQYTIHGEGSGRSVLSAVGDIDLLKMWDSDSAFTQLVLKDISIAGIGSGTSTKKGVWIARGTLGTLENVNITGFKYGLYLTQPNALEVRNSRFTNNWVGVWGQDSPNESFFHNIYATDNDSINFYWSGGFPVTLKSSGLSRAPYGVYVTNSGTVVLEGTNIEDCELFAVYVNGATLRTYNSIFNMTGETGARAAYLTGAQFYSNNTTYSVHASQAAAVTVANSNVRPVFDPPQNVKIEWTSLANDSKIFLGTNMPNYLVTQTGIATTDTTLRMREAYIPFNSAHNTGDDIMLTRKMAVGKFFRSYVLDGTDRRFSTTGAQPARVGKVREVIGYKTVTLGSGDSTFFDVVADTNGFSTLYYAAAHVFVEDTVNTNAIDYNVRPVYQDASAGNGFVRFLVVHPSAAFTNEKIFYNLVFVATNW